jgi:Uma2 family endonuclease
MSVTAQDLFQTLATDELLLSDEPQMESSQHYHQLQILVTGLEWHWRDRNDFFIGANLSVYYNRDHPRRRKFIGPDFFLVRNTERRPRPSWAIWKEGGRYPDLIIELLSPSTARVDRNDKKTFYHQQFRTPEYYWFSPDTLEFAGFHWAEEGYQPQIPNEHGLLWSPVLELSLGVSDGELRYFTAEGEKIATPDEAALRAYRRIDQEQQRAERAQRVAERAQQAVEQERQRAEQERQRAERLAAQLRALGVDPDTL